MHIGCAKSGGNKVTSFLGRALHDFKLIHQWLDQVHSSSIFLYCNNYLKSLKPKEKRSNNIIAHHDKNCCYYYIILDNIELS
jgi:hypothetical protein